MYGKSIQFVYKGKPFYSTICGLVISFIVFIIIFVFIILYLIDVFKYNQPTVINIPQYHSVPPNYLIYPYYKKEIFNDNNKVIKQKNFAKHQIAFGIKENNEWIDINSSYLIPIIKNIKSNNYKEQSELLFWDKCDNKTFLNIPMKSFENYNLDKVYCIYSPFEIEGEITNSIFKYFSFTLNLCKKDTYYVHEFNDSNIFDNFKNNNINFPNKEDSIYIDTNETDGEPIECVENIEETLKKYDFYFIYIDSIFNETSADKPLINFFDWKKIELSKEFHSYMEIYYQIDSISTFKSVLPKSLRKKNDSVRYLVEDNDKFILASSSYDEKKKKNFIYLYLF